MLLFSCLREERENSPDCFLRGASGAQVELAEAGAELQTEQSRRFFGKREVRFFVPVSHRKSGGADDRKMFPSLPPFDYRWAHDQHDQDLRRRPGIIHIFYGRGDEVMHPTE